jgi:hypothetical protein
LAISPGDEAKFKDGSDVVMVMWMLLLMAEGYPVYADVILDLASRGS